MVKVIVSSEGRVTLPAEIRMRDGVEAGQTFVIRRRRRGEYVLRRTKQRRNEGVVELLLNCPVKDWFQPMNRSETTDEVSPH